MKKTALFSFLTVFLCILTSCAPVIYEIGADSDIYTQMEGMAFFQSFPEAKGYADARVIHSEKDFSLVLVNNAPYAAETADFSHAFTRSGNLLSGEKTFHLADITLSSSGQQSLKDGSVSVAKAFGTIALDDGEIELSRRYMYPCIPFAENLPFEAYSPNAMGNGTFASAADCAFYELEDIPNGMIILPVQLGDVQYLAGDADYPLYESRFARIRKYLLPSLEKEAASMDGAFIRTSEDAYNVMEEKKSGKKYADNLYGHYDAAVSILDAFFTERVAALKDAPVLPKTFFIAGAGDLMMSRGSDWAMINVDSPNPVFNDTIPILKNSAIAIANLEGPVTTSNTSIEKSFVFKFRPEIAKYLRQAGFNYLRLNNMHTWDYGETGFKDTLKALADAGFATSGAGKNEEEASRFYRTEIAGYPVAILSVAASHIDPYNTNRRLSSASEKKAGILWETDRLADMIREEKKNGSIIVINVHGGAEYSSVPTADQQLMYRSLCDAGADVVFGSHPHVLQPVEWYGSSLIVWSLGNFMYPGMEDIAGTESGMIVRAGFVNGRLLYYEKYPTRNVGTTVRLVK